MALPLRRGSTGCYALGEGVNIPKRRTVVIKINVFAIQLSPRSPLLILREGVTVLLNIRGKTSCVGGELI
jgi:hypothetical protein